MQNAETKTINLKDATENQLNWLAAKCMGFLESRYEGEKPRVVLKEYGSLLMPHYNPMPQVYYESKYLPCTSFEEAGYIQQKNNIGVAAPFKAGGKWTAYQWIEYVPICEQQAETPQIAIVLCFVFSNMGSVVEVPLELE